MSELVSLRIGGVPEYFNLPIHLAIEKGEFQTAGIDLQWQMVPEGTGKMIKSLEERELDLAVTLTEGTVKSIAQGNPSKIIHIYVKSPLQWGVHVAAGSSFQRLEDLEHQRFAISRYTSGSHLMAILLAQKQGWDVNDDSFEVVHNLQGARKVLSENSAQIFLWEKYTTKFLVDSGEFRRIDLFPTPWPCFVVAATDRLINDHPQIVEQFLAVLKGAVRSFDAREDRAQLIADRYQLSLEDVGEFLPHTLWNADDISPQQLIDDVTTSLRSAGQLPS